MSAASSQWRSVKNFYKHNLVVYDIQDQIPWPRGIEIYVDVSWAARAVWRQCGIEALAEVVLTEAQSHNAETIHLRTQPRMSVGFQRRSQLTSEGGPHHAQQRLRRLL